MQMKHTTHSTIWIVGALILTVNASNSSGSCATAGNAITKANAPKAAHGMPIAIKPFVTKASAIGPPHSVSKMYATQAKYAAPIDINADKKINDATLIA